MKSIHLLSMPWAARTIPSIQIAALKAYLRENLSASFTVAAHHLHLYVVSDVFSDEEYSRDISRNIHEGYYMYLVMKEFGHELPFRVNPEDMMNDIIKHSTHLKLNFRFMDFDKLRAIQIATDRWLDSLVIDPSKNSEEVIVGMTTNFHQTYANVYAYFYIRRKLPEKKITFVLGGSSISYPQVLETLQRLNIDAYAVIGEGEKKLLSFINQVTKDESPVDHAKGIFHLSSALDTYEWQKSWFDSQISSLSELPLPDFDEYFHHLDTKLAFHQDWPVLRTKTELPFEGSRGCAFKCEFCNLNRFWDGYRKAPGEEIADRVLALRNRYKIKRVKFVDNLCDGWAKEFAEALVSKKTKIRFSMELRAKHQEEFWSTLATAGLTECKIGIEGLDDNILSRVRKGTTTLDIIYNQKILTEKMVFYGSRQLIAYYPRSTVEEVRNTKNILQLLLHMPKFDIDGFLMSIDSPIYNTLSLEEKKELKVHTGYATSLPENLQHLNVFFPLNTPEHLQPDARAKEEWSDLRRWYRTIDSRSWVKNSLLVNETGVSDRRDPANSVEIRFSPEEKQIYDLSHRPQTIQELSEKTGIDEAIVVSMIKKFEDLRIGYRSGNRFLALALRLSEENLAQLEKFTQDIIR